MAHALSLECEGKAHLVELLRIVVSITTDMGTVLGLSGVVAEGPAGVWRHFADTLQPQSGVLAADGSGDLDDEPGRPTTQFLDAAAMPVPGIHHVLDMWTADVHLDITGWTRSLGELKAITDVLVESRAT